MLAGVLFNFCLWAVNAIKICTRTHSTRAAKLFFSFLLFTSHSSLKFQQQRLHFAFTSFLRLFLCFALLSFATISDSFRPRFRCRGRSRSRSRSPFTGNVPVCLLPPVTAWTHNKRSVAHTTQNFYNCNGNRYSVSRPWQRLRTSVC